MPQDLNPEEEEKRRLELARRQNQARKKQYETRGKKIGGEIGKRAGQMLLPEAAPIAGTAGKYIGKKYGKEFGKELARVQNRARKRNGAPGDDNDRGPSPAQAGKAAARFLAKKVAKKLIFTVFMPSLGACLGCAGFLLLIVMILVIIGVVGGIFDEAVKEASLWLFNMRLKIWHSWGI